MGRDYYFVVVKKEKKHNTNKICFNLDYEPDTEEKDNILLKQFTNCKHFYEINTQHWCQVCDTCAWFLDPIKAYVDKEYSDNEEECNDNVEDTYHIRHCSDFTYSDYYFYHILSYTSSTTSHIYLQDGGGVYEVDKERLEYSMERLNEMPNPMRKTDIAASHQTHSLLNWLKKYCDNEKVQVLFFNE
jgi:hypothetical protein